MQEYQEIIQSILSKKIRTKDDLHRAKVALSRKHRLPSVPRDSEILAQLPNDLLENDTAMSLLRKKSMRTISGVAVVAAMTAPECCPHGRCVPCPGGPEQNTPQSYTGYEPAAMRASCNNFDPFKQVQSRVEQLHAIGHRTDKVDLIVMGGTFTARLPEYQEWFVKRCYDALNMKRSRTLAQAKQHNESAPSRCIGLTIETRPDWFRLQHADLVLALGATLVELGVQTVRDDVLHLIGRGHTVSDSITATRIAKDAGLKVCYHLMPGLPGSSTRRDLDSFRMVFQDPSFKPDKVKIYPTLVVKGTKLYDLWTAGQYEPLTTEAASRLIARLKQEVPPWVRIQRIQRDIPAHKISGGIKHSNLRQYVEKEMATHDLRCHCIRCREIGHRSLKAPLDLGHLHIELMCRRYTASNSDELFLSLEDASHDILLGYLRLRDITSSHRWEFDQDPCMVIREVRILGREAPLSGRTDGTFQHQGYGTQLIHEAERICREDYGKKVLCVLSGTGVKPYYRKLGFSDHGIYLRKQLD